MAELVSSGDVASKHAKYIITSFCKSTLCRRNSSCCGCTLVFLNQAQHGRDRWMLSEWTF